MAERKRYNSFTAGQAIARQRERSRAHLSSRSERPERIVRWSGEEGPLRLVRKTEGVGFGGSASGVARKVTIRPSAIRQIGTPLQIVAVVVVVMISAALGVRSYRYFHDRQILNRAVIYTSAPAPFAAPPIVPPNQFSPKARVFYRVKRGESWSGVLARHGFDRDTSREISAALIKLAAERKLDVSLPPGRTVQFTVGQRLGLKEVELQLEPTHRVEVERQNNGSYLAKLIDVRPDQVDRVATGEITTSLSAAATKAGVSYVVIDDLVDLFSDRIEFREDLHPGDRFTIIYRDMVTPEGDSAQPGPILAAALDAGGERYIAARYVGTDGKARYFDAKGAPLGNSFLRYPVVFSRISSTFSFARFHPILKRSRAHNGVDFAAPTGTPVRAVASGKVVFAAAKGGSGNMVRIQHGDRYTTEYLHLSKIAAGIRKGIAVERGQVIGGVGMTGLATGPHLHFGFFENGKYVDPLKIKLPYLDDLRKGLKIDSQYLRKVLFTLEHYQSFELR